MQLPRPGAGTALARLAVAACAAVTSMAALGDGVSATGFRPPPFRLKITKADGAKGSGRRLKSTPLPSSWDSRDHGLVTPVKDQKPLGTCWAFAANAVIETQLRRAWINENDLHESAPPESDIPGWDLSEKNMVLLSGFDGDWNLGGNNDMAAAYLLRWGGAVAETNDVYLTHANSYYDESRARDEWENVRPSHPLDPALHIQNVVLVPALDGTEATRNELKEAIRKYGAVATCAYWDYDCENESAFYYSGNRTYYGNPYCDHAITVIGWNDEYPAGNFKTLPPSNGAWLIKNSWGTESGDHGYWYVSYYDTRFAVYDGAVFLPATESENYTAVYGYDKFGCIYDFATAYAGKFDPFDLMAAVFTSGWNEELAAVGLYTLVTPCPYEISIYTNVTRNAETPTEGGVLACRMSGTLSCAGFTTIHLPAPIALADHTTFSVVYRQTGSEMSNPLCCTYIGYCYPNLALGQSYFGRSGANDGEDTWIDGANKDFINQVDHTDEAWAACIKAYTRSTVPAKAGDAPGETADGADALAALAATNALACAQHGETFGAFANVVGANGRTLYASWLAGLDPADSASDFRLFIAVTNDVPSLTWTPDLGEERRKYTIRGNVTPFADGDWPVLTKEELAGTSNRFFKVTVSPR